jgi:hypothetical protein
MMSKLLFHVPIHKIPTKSWWRGWEAPPSLGWEGDDSGVLESTDKWEGGGHDSRASHNRLAPVQARIRRICLFARGAVIHGKLR